MKVDPKSSIPGWRYVPLIDMADYHNGMAFKPSDWVEEGARIIRIEQLNHPDGRYDHYQGAYADIYHVENGDLIFSWSATLKVAIWKHGPGVLNQHLFKVIPKPGYDKRFLYYLLDHHMEDIGGGSHGSTMKHIKRGELQTYEVAAPYDEAEQRKIAHILTTVDDLIDRSEALIAKLRAIKQGLMHDLLTRGVDEHGQLRPPREEAPELYKESAVGWVPREWQICPTGDVFDMRLGKMLSKASKTGQNSFPYIANRNVQWDYIDLSDLDEMDFTEAEREKYALEPGDLLICEGGEVGRTAIWQGETANCYFQKAIHRLRPKDDRVLPTYMLSYMRFAANIGRLFHYTSQSSIAHLTGEKLVLLPIALPPRDEQLRIVAVLDSAGTQIQIEEVNLAKLVELKIGLMQDLLTGKVRVTVD